MPSRYEEFDRSRLNILPLADRQHDLDLSAILPLDQVAVDHGELVEVAKRIRAARQEGRPVVLMMGAHVLRAGVQRYLIDMMEQGYLSCVAMNGAGVIHDFEFAAIGATTESVAHYIRDGRFGMWRDTGRINDIIAAGAKDGLGLGEAVGRVIEQEAFPRRDISVLAAGYRLGIPITVHVGIGYDIIHELPNCDGAALGAASYRDFLIFARVLEGLERGVIMNFGSAVMGPEVYLKALAMARNVANREKREIRHFTSLVCDLAPLPEDYSSEPCKSNSMYYFRPWKTILVRTVADGGKSFYVQGGHAETIPQLWTALHQQTRRGQP
ncbi:MAG: hypothetical protein KKC76_18250 [Proteobacteria bacterium]|nr:hypothetical protein [Pseudomonadota bacterium]MBU4296646.1 hypothetical protein [Pseudomonadota bacterium]MCG2748439.1 hypothetical protein [Desulfobulbaceae bacterium]